MRVLIVDDEPAARRRLAIMLDELDVEVVGEAANGVEALTLAAERRPDVVLLDIAMPEVDGFDVVRHLDPPRPLIVFQTAYDEYALKAFEHEALDYVVKPVTLQRLDQALDRARRRLEGTMRPAFSQDLIERLQATVTRGAPARRPRLLVRDGAGHRLLPLGEIVRFTAAEGTVVARTAEGDFPTDYTLADLEQRTAGAFIRPNRSELLNVDRIVRIEGAGDGSAELTLASGERVHVSRRRATEVRKVLAG